MAVTAPLARPERRLLVVSHACVAPINQRLFGILQERTGWGVTLVVPREWKDDYGNLRRPEQHPEFGGRLIPLPALLKGNIPLHFYQSWFVRLLQREGPDAIYVHHEPYGLATFQVYLANSVTGNRPIGFYAAQNILKRYPRPFRDFEHYVFRHSAFAFPVTRSALEVLRARGYRGPAVLLPLGVDPQVYSPTGDREALRRRLGAADHEWLVGYVGRIVEEKGLHVLVEALAAMDHVPWRLLLIGAGPFEAELDTLIRRRGVESRVVRLGFVPHPEVPAYLGALDVAVLPSQTRAHWKEQFGRVLVEALACGTPVVGSDSGAIPEVITDTGGGLIFPEGSVDGLREALLTLFQDASLRERLARAGRQAVLERYTLPSLADQMAEALSPLVECR